MYVVPIIFAVFGMIFLVWLFAIFNRFVRVRQHIRESWSDIDVELKRRYELIPNLVSAVRAYAMHERKTLARVIDLRNRAVANTGPAGGRASDEAALQIGMKQVFAIAEAYPKLKADTHFLSLQQELANCEDRIAAARRLFNGNVRELNQLCNQIPTNLVATLCGFRRATYFEITGDAERVVPRVDLSPVRPGSSV